MIYIFGDSYGDARSNETRSSVWYNMLKHHEDVKNYCIGAIGPIDHFKLFWKEYDNQKVKVLSVSKLFAEAIRRVHHDESISVLFS